MSTNPQPGFSLIPTFPRRRPADSPLPNGPQQLVTLLLDVSASMSGPPIHQVQESAADFQRECAGDVLTRERLQVQLATFGGSVQIHPFVPIPQFTPPQLVASGDTPLAEALIAAIDQTERHASFLRRVAELEVPKPYYFLFSDGCPSSPHSLLNEAAAAVAHKEQTGSGAFYGFGIDEAAVEALQPLFTRRVHLLSGQDFAEFFHVVSVSVRIVSARCVSGDVDIDPSNFMINRRLPRIGGHDA